MKVRFVAKFHYTLELSNFGNNLTAMKVAERYKKICCIGRIVSYVMEMKTKVENIL